MTTKLTNLDSNSPSPIKRVVTLLSCVLLPLNLMANSLDGLEYSELPDGGIQIKLSLSESAVTPSGFTIDQPPRLILDFPETQNELPRQKVNMGPTPAKIDSTAVRPSSV